MIVGPIVHDDPPTQVAFFRGMNLGQARSKSPTSAVLVEAFTAAGAVSTSNFQTNGTVIFAASDPDGVVAGARSALMAATGYADAVVVRSSQWVRELAGRIDPGLPGGELALFDALSTPEILHTQGCRQFQRHELVQLGPAGRQCFRSDLQLWTTRDLARRCG